jgi:hypothetical protein
MSHNYPRPLGDDWLTWDPEEIDAYPSGRERTNDATIRSDEIASAGFTLHRRDRPESLINPDLKYLP